MSTLIDITLRLDEQTLAVSREMNPCGPPAPAEMDYHFTTVTLGLHTGTHVDAPAHFLSDGLQVHELGLQHFHGPAVVVELRSDEPLIGREQVESQVKRKGQHILLKTTNSSLLRSQKFTPDYTALTPEAAAYLASLNPLSVGFDYYSLAAIDEAGYPAHRVMARAGIPVFVCLNLLEVEPGAYRFFGVAAQARSGRGQPPCALCCGGKSAVPVCCFKLIFSAWVRLF